MYRFYRVAGAWVIAGMLLAACGDQQSRQSEAQPEAGPPEQGWATVNGSVLTDDEFDAAVSRFFGDQPVDARALNNLRESLITSRALSQQAERTLDDSTRLSIELAVRAYREERLIAAYLDQTSSPEPVSAADVQRYYDTHLEDFGAKTVKRLELLRVGYGGGAQGVAVTDAVQWLNEAGESDWSGWLNAHEGMPVERLRVTANDQLPARLRAAIAPLAVGQVSGVIVEGDAAYRMKVLAVDDIPPKPLSEVSGDIRRRLAAAQLKRAISALSDDVLANSHIERLYD